MKLKFAVYLTALLVALLVAGCGDEKINEGEGGETATEQTAATGETSSSEGSGDAKLPTVSGKVGDEPELKIPSGDAPTELVTKDIKKGDGKTAKAGDTLSMQYVGYNWSDGVMFDGSYSRGEPFEFELGAGNVIQGWDEGIEGMKEGGRRLLVIPPEKGYGEAGSPPSIPPNETLVFVVDLEDVK